MLMPHHFVDAIANTADVVMRTDEPTLRVCVRHRVAVRVKSTLNMGTNRFTHMCVPMPANYCIVVQDCITSV